MKVSRTTRANQGDITLPLTVSALRAIRFCAENELVGILPLRNLTRRPGFEAKPIAIGDGKEIANCALRSESKRLSHAVGRFDSTQGA